MILVDGYVNDDVRITKEGCDDSRRVLEVREGRKEILPRFDTWHDRFK